MLMIDERPVRNSVLVISRTIASKRCASTAINVGSSSRAAGVGPAAPAPACGALVGTCSGIVELQSVVAELADVRAPAGVDDDRRLRLDHERRAGDRCVPGASRAAEVHRDLDLAELAGRRRRGAHGAVCAEPGAASAASGGLAVLAVTRPFHWLSSIFCPGSRTAKIRSCASWKLSIRRASAARPRRRRRRAGSTGPTPGRRSAPRRSSAGCTSPASPGGSSDSNARMRSRSARSVSRDAVEVELLRVGHVRRGHLADDVRVLSAERREHAGGARDQHLAAAELARDRGDRQARPRRRRRRASSRAGRRPR